MQRPAKIFFDGCCRPNPGIMEIALVADGCTTIRQGVGHVKRTQNLAGIALARLHER